MISSTSHRCPGGPEASSDPVCQRFKAANIFTLETDVWNGASDSNYWLAETGKAGEDQGFVIDLGCTKMVSGVNLRNTHNAQHRDRSTKRFRLLGSLNNNGPWQELLNENLEDSRQQNPPPVQQLMFCTPAMIQFIKFELLEFWAPGNGGNGGGLQYLATISPGTTSSSDSWTSLYSRPEEMPIVEETLLTSFDILPNEWKVIFELKPTNLTLNPWDDWLNIFHMTNWAGRDVFGDKNPKITFSSSQGLFICSAVEDDPRYCIIGLEDMLAVGKWTRFEVSQELEGTKLMFKVVINRARVAYMENKLTGSVKDVKVYASTGGGQGALPGYIKDLSILVKSGQCVVDSSTHRVLPIHLPSTLDASNSPTTCIARCLELGHAYAGVQASDECYCGDAHPTTITCKSECSVDCPGDSEQKCGSSFRMNVWPTDLEPIPNDTPITGPDADASPDEIEAAFNVISSTQSASIRAGMNSRKCLFPNRAAKKEQSQEETAKPPPIDIFINPERSSEMEKISSTMMETATNYFATSDMSRLYPELFRTLWEYTLPCLPEPGIERAMLRSCSVGGIEIPCGDIFKKVPTDSGCKCLYCTSEEMVIFIRQVCAVP